MLCRNLKSTFSLWDIALFSYHISMFKAFDRYSAFTDLKALNAMSARPLRKSIRVNTLKCTVEEVMAWAKAKNWTLEPVPWCSEGFFIDRVDREEALGKDLLHLFGGFYMQEAASMLPVALLDPKPGESILDMSAAPGSKTTQIGDRMQGRGVLIANDVQEKRIWSLVTNLQRSGVMNVVITRKVGQWFAGNMTERFDRVLCDAPCTAQGTVRKDTDSLDYCSMDNIGKMAKLQRELLESAVHACKVGGRIVYSTCTLTPEENEEVVRSIVNKFSTQLVVLHPAEILECDFSKAIEDSTSVQESLTSRSQIPHNPNPHPQPSLRLWPQTYDTEGFFSAVIEKRAPTRDRGTVRSENQPHEWQVLPKARVKEIADNLIDWYGVSFIRDDEVLTENKEQLSIMPKRIVDFPLTLQPYFGGLPFGKSTNHGLVRLSHEIATLRGLEAQKQVLVITELQMRDMMKGVNLPVAKPEGMDDGDVLLAVDFPVLGRKMIVGRGVLKAGIVMNRLPRDMVRMFS